MLVGSSMGGWIALLLARRIPQRIAGLVGVAAAPDFTEDAMWAQFDADQRSRLEADGQVELPSDYASDPYPITRRLIEDGRRNLVLRSPLDLPFPVRLLHGTDDRDVDLSVALRLIAHVARTGRPADHRQGRRPSLQRGRHPRPAGRDRRQHRLAPSIRHARFEINRARRPHGERGRRNVDGQAYACVASRSISSLR